MKGRKMRRRLVLVLILSVNLLIVGSLAASRQEPWRDEFIYLDVAENIYEGQGYSTDFKYDVTNPRVLPPYPFDRRFLYPYLCALVFHVIDKASTKACSLISVIFQAGQAAVLFYLGRELFDYRTGLLAALLYSLNPWYHYLGTTVLTDMTATFFYYLCLFVFLRYLTERTRAWAILGGVSFAVAFLAREETILFGLFVVIALLLIRSPKEHFLWFSSFFLAVFLLRGWYLHKVFGSFTYNAQPLPVLADWEIFYSLEPHTWSKYLEDVGGVGGAITVRVINYLTFARNFFSDGVIFDTDSVMGVMPLSVLLPLVLVYLGKITQERRKLLIALGLLFLAQTMFTLSYPGYAVISAGSRHGQLLAPFLLLMASAGLLSQRGEAIGNLKSRVRQLLTRALPVLKGIFIVNYALFCFIFSAVNIERSVKSYSGTELSEITRWGKDHLPATAVLMTRKPQEAHYYSNRTAVSAPLAPFVVMMRYAERNGVTHIVLSHKERSWRPNLLPGVMAYPANFKLLHEEDRAQIYEILSYDFGSEKVKVAEDEALLNSYTHPLEHLTWEDILRRKRYDNFSRSLRVWGQLLADGKRIAQERWDEVKYGQWNWLYKIVHRPERRLEVDFGEFRLLGYSLDTNALEDKGVLDVALYWQSLEPVKEDYIVVVKLVNGVYHVWGESQGKLWGDEFWASHWTEELVIGDSHHIELLPATPPGLYQLEVNVVDPRSWQTLEPDGEAKVLSEPLEIPRHSLKIEALDMEHPLGTELGGKVRLLGYHIESGFRPGDNIHLTLFWQCLEEMEQSYIVFNHLVDAGDHIVAQKDNPPVDGFYPTTKWEVGEIVRDQYDLVIPSDVPSSKYWLNVGMYLAETGERLNVLEDGIPLPDHQILLQPVTVENVE